jgi:ATP-dependent Clp protease ATP-binding subunit ClpA
MMQATTDLRDGNAHESLAKSGTVAPAGRIGCPGSGPRTRDAGDLLLALTDDDDALTAMRAMRIDLDLLRNDIEAYMNGVVDEDTDAPSEAPNYTSDLHRVLQLASTQVQTSRRDVVDGADVLVELLAEPAGHFLQKQGLTRYDLLSFLRHGIEGSGICKANPAWRRGNF